MADMRKDTGSTHSAAIAILQFMKKVPTAISVVEIQEPTTQMILKLGIATVALTGGVLLVKGEIDILTFFVFLLLVSRMYDPLQAAMSYPLGSMVLAPVWISWDRISSRRSHCTLVLIIAARFCSC